MFLLMFLQAKWPPEPRNHHTTNDRDWSWRAPDLSIMMSKLCSYMSTGSFVKWYIKHFKTTLNECTAWWKLWKYIYIYSWCEGKFSTTTGIVRTVFPLNQVHVPAQRDSSLFFFLSLYFLSTVSDNLYLSVFSANSVIYDVSIIESGSAWKFN